MIRIHLPCLLSFFIGLVMLLPVTVSADLYITIVQGLDGTPEYGQQFSDQVGKLRMAAESVTDKKLIKLITGEEATRENILSHFNGLDESLAAGDRLAVFLIGHGSYDGYEYKFNIPGPDLTDADLTGMMDTLPAKTQLLVNTSSASGELMEGMKKDTRIVITATRNGSERLATRFGTYFADAFLDPAADINKNNAVSVQEAFDYAERQVKDYFESAGQLATEHPVIAGEMASQFVLARTGSVPQQDGDPALAGLIEQRNRIDTRIEDLQLRKNNMAPDDYLNQLQMLMIDLSTVQDRIDQHNNNGGQNGP